MWTEEGPAFPRCSNLSNGNSSCKPLFTMFVANFVPKEDTECDVSFCVCNATSSPTLNMRERERGFSLEFLTRCCAKLGAEEGFEVYE